MTAAAGGPGATSAADGEALDLLVVGAGPTGIAIGAAAGAAGLSVLVVDQGSIAASIQGYPTFMTFFSSREQLQIAGVPFAIPEPKPSRRQALVYYRAVADHHRVPLALYEEVTAISPGRSGGFTVRSRELGGFEAGEGGERVRAAGAVALATGYFGNPRRLGVPGEELPWVHHRYLEPYPHARRRVVVVGGGNSAAEAALELWRGGARVTLVHRGPEVRRSVKYWLKPDLENRIRDGAIAAHFDTEVAGFDRRGVALAAIGGGGGGGVAGHLPADIAFVLIGYLPDTGLAAGAGVEIDAETLKPAYDPETCESNVPGLYVAGTLQAGLATGDIFIENTRDHGERIVAHLTARR